MKELEWIAANQVYKSIFAHWEKYTHLSKVTREEIYLHSKVARFAKNERLQELGKYVNSLFYLADGFCISFCDTQIKDHVLDFWTTNEWCTSWYAFGNKQVAPVHIMALRESISIIFSYEEYNILLTKCLDFAYISHRMLMEQTGKFEERVLVNHVYSAKERITYFRDYHLLQELMIQMSHKQIASLLRMTPETFSKLLRDLNMS
ncbi:Crp/Fnr family transcriptional regulator [Parabacteroides sp.]